MKTKIISSDKYKIELKLPSGGITIGPGTVPTSGASVSTTSIEQITADLREASKLGLYSSFNTK